MGFFNKILSALGLGQSKASKEAQHVKEALKLAEYVSNHIGKIYSTISFNMLTTGDPLTIIIVEPTKERDCYLLVTAGMSDKPMYIRKGNPYYKELIMGLPKSWIAPKNEDDLSSLGPDDLFPLIMLLKLAEAPRITGEPLQSGDVMLLDEYFGMDVTRALFYIPALPDLEFSHIHISLKLPTYIKVSANESTTGDNEYLGFEGVYPITDEEYDLMQRLNCHFLMDELHSKGVGLVFEIERKSVVAKKEKDPAPKKTKKASTADKSFDEILKENSKTFEKNTAALAQIKIVKNIPSLKDSKFGGEPYWPKGKTYPISPEGERLDMAVQINCADVPVSLGWPKEGIVQFFINGNDDLMGADLNDPTNQDGFRVIYHEDVEIEHETQVLQKHDYMPFDTSNPMKIEFIEGVMLPDPAMSYVDPKLDEIFIGHEDEYYDYRTQHRADQFGELEPHQIGGYPDFIQDDPRDKTQAKSTYSTLLLQVSSDDENSIMWGDYGSAQFFISPANLKKKDFSKVMYNWACH